MSCADETGSDQQVIEEELCAFLREVQKRVRVNDLVIDKWHKEANQK
jgi:hypothetical protein